MQSYPNPTPSVTLPAVASHLLRPSEERRARAFLSSLGLLAVYNKDIETKLGLGNGPGTGLARGQGQGQGQGMGMGTSRGNRTSRTARTAGATGAGAISDIDMDNDNDYDDRSYTSVSSTAGDPHLRKTAAASSSTNRVTSHTNPDPTLFQHNP